MEGYYSKYQQNAGRTVGTVTKIVADAAGKQTKEIKKDTLFSDLPIDSLEFIMVVADVEKALGVKISNEQTLQIHTVGDLIGMARQ